MKKRIAHIFSAVILIVSIALLAAVTAFADERPPVEYRFFNGTSWETRECTDYALVSDFPTSVRNLEWSSGWYVVDKDPTFYTITVSGDVHLILKDSCCLKANYGINVSKGNSLTIYGQSDRGGTLNAFGQKNGELSYGAGIGGGDGQDCGTVTIHGGRIYAIGASMAAGIGGGNGGDGGDVTVYGGYVQASGGDTDITKILGLIKTEEGGLALAHQFKDSSGAGIGGGDWGDGGTFKMYGGEVVAFGVNKSAGIGGGNWGNSGSFEFYGGNLTASSNDSSVPAVGNGDGGHYAASSHTYIGDNLILINNRTGKLLDNAFDMTYIEWAHYLEQSSFSLTGLHPADCPVQYVTLDEAGNEDIAECTDYKHLTRSDTVWQSGWYVMEETGTIPFSVAVNGDVHLILKNGCQLTANQGIWVPEDSSLTIHPQPSENGAPAGTLIANGHNRQYAAGIGSISDGPCGTVTIHGGNITATGNYGAAGIGGGYAKNGGNVTVYGGNITANGGGSAAGIGGGMGVNGGTLAIHGGSITATAGQYAPRAIGGGYYASGKPAPDNGSITVNSGILLYDKGTNAVITKDAAQEWIDVLNGSSVSFYTAEKTVPTTYTVYNTETGKYQSRTHDCLELKNLSRILKSNWYTVPEDMTLGALTVKGDIHLILKDNCTLTVNGGINILPGSSLTVYAQSTDSAAMGKLVVSGADGTAGISGDFAMHGGDVTANGGSSTAGIRGSAVIYGGCLNAVGGSNAAGIDGDIRMTVYKGSVSAVAGSGAARGIGVGSGTITVEKHSMLVGSDSEPITKPAGQTWFDVLSGNSVSFTAVKAPVSYLAYNTEDKSFETLNCSSYEFINPSTTQWADNWYVLNGNNITISQTVNVSGNVYLILEDGVSLAVNGGIKVENGSTLTVYAQSANGTAAGKLIAIGAEHTAGIGGSWKRDSGTITVHGGNIRAIGGYKAAGIGGGEEGDGGSFVMYGGKVYAMGGQYGAGIGSGANIQSGGYSTGWSGDVTIYGGVVEAIGSSDEIGGGGGAGIGGGQYGDCERITIYGGDVTARGSRFAAGVGGGHYGMAGIVTVNGGSLTAFGGAGSAGIGGSAYGAGPYEDGGELNFNGGTVTAKCGDQGKRAIGAGAFGSNSGIIRIVEGVKLIDQSTGKDIELPVGKEWVDVLTDSEYSLTLTPDTDDGTVEYLLRKGTEPGVCKVYTQIRPDTVAWTDGWYVADSTLELDHATVNGDVHLILKDRRTLTVSHGILLEKGSSLTIYAQSTDDDMGVLITDGDQFCAGIGGGDGGDCGVVTIYGGRITANGGDYAAGIGGGYAGDGSTVTAYGGYVVATGGTGADGVGGGHYGTVGTLVVYDDAVVISNGQQVPTTHLHLVSEIPTKAATCTEEGVSAVYYVCTGEHGCGKYFADADATVELTEQQLSAYIAPALGHDFTSGKYLLYTNNTHSQKCTRCDEYSDQIEHSFVNGVCVCGETEYFVYSRIVRSDETIDLGGKVMTVARALTVNNGGKIINGALRIKNGATVSLGENGSWVPVWTESADGYTLYQLCEVALKTGKDVEDLGNGAKFAFGYKYADTASYQRTITADAVNELRVGARLEWANGRSDYTGNFTFSQESIAKMSEVDINDPDSFYRISMKMAGNGISELSVAPLIRCNALGFRLLGPEGTWQK